MCSKLTFEPIAKCKSCVTGANSVTQHLLLEIDDRFQHCCILDLGGRNHDAAVHEVTDGVGQVFFGLRQKGLQTEHLSRPNTAL